MSDKWQPMETFPRDGTEVFVRLPNGRVETAYWVQETVTRFGKVVRERDEMVVGYMSWAMGEKPVPTYWMPIPSPELERENA